jgi:hypothetical protein
MAAMAGVRFFASHVAAVEESGATAACVALMSELAATCAFVSVDLEFSGLGPKAGRSER